MSLRHRQVRPETGALTLKDEHEERVYYFRQDGTPSSVCGVVDAKSDPHFILVKRRAGVVKILRERLDFIGPSGSRPDGATT